MNTTACLLIIPPFFKLTTKYLLNKIKQKFPTLQNYILNYLGIWGDKFLRIPVRKIFTSILRQTAHTAMGSTALGVSEAIPVLSTLSLLFPDLSGGFLTWEIRILLCGFLLKVFIS